MEIQPIDPNHPFIVTLSMQEWKLIITGINELPHRIARNLFDKVLGQLQQQEMEMGKQ